MIFFPSVISITVQSLVDLGGECCVLGGLGWYFLSSWSIPVGNIGEESFGGDDWPWGIGCLPAILKGLSLFLGFVFGSEIKIGSEGRPLIFPDVLSEITFVERNFCDLLKFFLFFSIISYMPS